MRRLEALSRIFGEACTDRAVEQAWSERLAGDDRLWVFFQDGGEYAELRFAFKSASSR